MPDGCHCRFRRTRGLLWHACSTLRELRGDSHLSALTAAGLDSVQANLLTELWVGWEPLTYAGTRGWSPASMQVANAALSARGLVAARGLTDAGRVLREDIEARTDAALQPAIDALGDGLEPLIDLLGDWSEQIVVHGWFPPDPYKRAAG